VIVHRVALLLALAGCTTSLPEIPPEGFWCEGDAPIEPGLFPCPETHGCVGGQCLPRLNCVEPAQDLPGCTKDVSRCDLALSAEIAAVRCASGLYTQTSTPPADPATCACPDGLVCAAWGTLDAAPQAETLPLFVLPEDLSPKVLPASGGIMGERAIGRMCVRVCGSELDCPANHTCRAAPVLSSGMLPSDSRRTIGVCYPEILPTTATVADQPDPLACAAERDCTVAEGRFDGLCQARVVTVPDHPLVPAAEAWGLRRAIRSVCVSDNQSNLRVDGDGCLDGAECQSGICLGRCAKLCDPTDESPCGFARSCAEELVERSLPGGADRVFDRLFVCS
jgi:hypothetical protein